MNARLFLRSASLLILLFGIGHTLGYPWVGSASPALTSKVNEIRSITTLTQGFARSYWDFHIGFGLFISLTLLAQAILIWRLASLAATEPRTARVAAAVFCGLFVADIVLDLKYFFWGPIVFCVAIAACLAVATLLLTRELKFSASRPSATPPKEASAA